MNPTSHALPSDYPAEPMLHDRVSRDRKARKMLAVLEHALGPDLSDRRCLDIGCASGLITRVLALRLQWAIGLEYDPDAVERMDASDMDNLLFLRGDATRLPLPDAAVDLVVCAQVYEHVSDADALAEEVYRVLRPGGVCFFSGPNRLDLIERHYGLPFLSWLPRPLADGYVRLTRRGTAYRERPRAYWGLRRLWGRFKIRDYTADMIRNPAAFGCAVEVGSLAWVGRLPTWALRLLTPLYPNYNWVLVKPGEGSSWQ